MRLLTGFGNPDTQDFAYFTHLVSKDSHITPDWYPTLQTVQDPIVGSDDVEIQIMGFESARLQARLLFPDRESYFRLQAMISRKATLVLLASHTRFRGEVFHRLGKDYEKHVNVLLIDLVPELRVGATLATATFIRSASGMGVSSL